MNLTQFEEFVTFARYLNISKAADALFISPSSLSKHIKQLESDLGFDLIYKKSNHIYLTDEGAHFLNGIQSVLTDYDVLIDDCFRIKSNAFPKLILQDPPFSDKACTALYELVNAIRKEMKAVRIDFIHEKFKDLLPMLLSDDVHVLLQYHCGNIERIIHDYANKGVLAIEISNEPLVAWGKRFVFEGVENVDADMLKELSIMLSSDASSPVSALISELPEYLGFSPKVCISPARSAAQYYYSEHKRSIYLLPESYSTKEVFTSRSDMRVIPLINGTITCRALALINTNGKYFELLSHLLQSKQVAE